MSKHHRGRHQSTCKDGRRTIALLENIPGVTAVILGKTVGHKSAARGKRAGYFKLQRKIPNGFKGILQCSYGAQELAVVVQVEKQDAVDQEIRKLFPQD